MKSISVVVAACLVLGFSIDVIAATEKSSPPTCMDYNGTWVPDNGGTALQIKQVGCLKIKLSNQMEELQLGETQYQTTETDSQIQKATNVATWDDRMQTLILFRYFENHEMQTIKYTTMSLVTTYKRTGDTRTRTARGFNEQGEPVQSTTTYTRQ